jgi:Tfp pilus assembly protein PilO
MTNRIWTIGTVLACVLLLVMGYFLGIGPTLAAAKAANEQGDAIDAQNAAQELEIEALKSEFAQLDEVRAKLDALRVGLPTDADSSTFVRELAANADATGVAITTYGAGEGVFYAPATPNPVTGVPLVDPLVTASNLATYAIGLEAAGSYEALVEFIAGLQGDNRLFLISSVDIARDGEGASTSYTARIAGSIYALTDAPVEPVVAPCRK